METRLLTVEKYIEDEILVNETFSCVEGKLTEDLVQLSQPIDDIISEQLEDTQISLTEQ